MPNEPLDIAIITVDEYYYIPKFIEPLFNQDEFRIVNLTAVPPSLGTETLPKFAYRLFQTFGPRVFLQHGLFYGKYMLLDSFHRFFGIGQPRSPRSLAEKYGVDYTYTTDVNSQEYKDQLRKLSPDVLVSVAATQKFDEELLQVPEDSAINIHSSLLPEYRGVSPSFWTLLNDEDTTGVTVHYMDADIDSGEIIRQSPLEIRHDDSQHSLNERIAEVGSGILIDALRDIRNGEVTSKPINSEEGSYFSMPTRADVQEFLENGNSFY